MNPSNIARVAGLLAPLAAAAVAAADIRITEVAPWSSGNSAVAADWFELTNTGNAAVDITGWRFDDDSNTFASSVLLTGITSIAPGESVIFLETTTLAARAQIFRDIWFGANAPAGLRFGSYSGAGTGLSTGGDQVNIFDAAGVSQARILFGTSTAFRTFDNAQGLNGQAVTLLSSLNVNSAFTSANGLETGSPGVIPSPAAAALLGLGALAAGRRRR